MITREEAVALLAHAPDYWLAPGDGSIENVQGATIAHVHEHANLRTMDRTGETHSSADSRLIAAAPDLARTVVALYDECVRVTVERDAARIVLQQLAPLDRVEWTWPDDFPDGEKPDCLCSACGDAVLVETGHEWAQGRDVCHDCAAMRSEALSGATRQRDALRAELDTFAAFHRNKTDALALELRRLRAAEAPGTDDEAFEGTGWRWDGPERTWIHDSTGFITRQVSTVRPWLVENDPSIQCARLALDAMRAAVPGSV